MHKPLKPQTASKAMTRFGIGPTLATLSILYCLATFTATKHFAPLFNIRILSANIRIAIGVALILIGTVFFVVAVCATTRAYNAGKLCTKGIFGLCRHPVYSAWIVFLVPAMAVLADSLLGLTAPFVMYVLLKILIPKEDRYLEEKFGAEYTSYKRNVPEVLPIGWIKK